MQGHSPVGLDARQGEARFHASPLHSLASSRLRGQAVLSILARPLTLTIGGAEVVLHLTGVLLFAAVAVALNLTFLHHLVPHPPPTVVLLVLVFITLAHETGHALAFRLQGARDIRIVLCGTGGSCTAIVEHDTARRVFARALAGPSVTALVIGMLLVVSSICPAPFAWRMATMAAIIFTAGVEAFNVLPMHSQSDGTVALYALVWLISGQEPKQFDVLYMWRPLALTAIGLMVLIYSFMANLIPFNWTIFISVAMTTLLLFALPLLMLAKWFLYRFDNKAE